MRWFLTFWIYLRQNEQQRIIRFAYTIISISSTTAWMGIFNAHWNISIINANPKLYIWNMYLNLFSLFPSFFVPVSYLQWFFVRSKFRWWIQTFDSQFLRFKLRLLFFLVEDEKCFIVFNGNATQWEIIDYIFKYFFYLEYWQTRLLITMRTLSIFEWRSKYFQVSLRYLFPICNRKSIITDFWFHHHYFEHANR